MAQGARLPFRLAPRWPKAVTLGGPVFITAAWLAIGVFLLRDDSLLPHQLQMAGALLGVMTLLCLIGLARTLVTAVVAPATSVEVDRLPAPRGAPLRCSVAQQGTGLRRIDVRLQCLREAGRGAEDLVVDLPLGTSTPDAGSALRARLEADVTLPADAPPSEINRVRWRLRVVASFDAVRDVVRDFPLTVV